jgi:hypothetical protein
MTDSRTLYQLAAPDLSNAASALKFSIIIPVYNDWLSLNECLRSLARQASAPNFEIIIVDDGSKEAAPKFISKWNEHYSLTVIRESHAGISFARNRGIQASKAPILLFVDADCRLDLKCLQMLERTMDALPQQNYFQLHLVGDCSNGTVGKTEDLRLMALQNQFIRLDNSVRYLNTAGFAIRRNKADSDAGLFDPIAIRAEDTLLLANLIRRDELPLFVPDAIVQHAIPLCVVAYLRKAMHSAYLEGKTFDIISSTGVAIRLGHGERLRMLGLTWKLSADRKIGRTAWFVLLTRQTLRLIATFCYQYLRPKCS